MSAVRTRDEIRAALRTKKVGIAGAGGLGSNCAIALARAGIGNLLLADFDVVASRDLDRQAFFLDQVNLPKVEALAQTIRRIDPDLRVDARVMRLTARAAVELYRGCDAVVEAFDEAAAKLELIEALRASLPGCFVVGASGIAGWGGADDLRVRRSRGLAMVGDFESEVGELLPPLAPRVGAAACMEAAEVLAHLLGEGAAE